MTIVAYRRLNLLTILLCFVVVTLGAFVRLSDAGLGCPDWPGCYGQLIGVPESIAEISNAESAYPDRPVEAHKAWKEVIHRYAAGMLGLMILALFILAVRQKSGRAPAVSALLPAVLCVLVLFQALLGMWTVTLLLKPLIVTAHLLGGMTILALLFLNYLRTAPAAASPVTQRFRDREPRNEREAWQAQRTASSAAPADPVPSSRMLVLAGVVLLLLIGQIFLGAWTSSNYAALACPDLPTCQGSLWPETDFENAFLMWRGVGINYEFGVLDSAARATIHVMHRLGAVVVTATAGLLALLLWTGGAAVWRRYAALLCLALLVQLGIGIGIVLLQLPLPLAVAHNGGAALLLLVLTGINERLWRARLATS